MLHSSPRWFSIGVPVSPSRQPARSDAQRLGPLGGGVLDRLGLVDNQGGELDARELLGVQGGDGVAGDHHVARAQPAQAGLPLGPAVQADLQLGGEARRLGDPVAGHRGGGHHQGRPQRRPVGQHRERLDGLSQPHLVGQDRPRPPVRQPGQPDHARLLVRTQPLGQRGRQARARHVSLLHPPPQGLEGGALLDLRLLLHQPDQRIAGHARQLDGPPVVEHRRLGPLQRGPQGLLDPDEAAGADLHVTAALPDRRQQLEQRHHQVGGAPHLGAPLHREPVALVGHLHAHLAAPHAAVRGQVVVGPLDHDLLAHLLQRRHQVQRGVALAHPPAPRLLLLPGAQREPLGEGVAGLPLGRQVAAGAVAVAPLALENQGRALTGREDGAELHRADAHADLERARGQQVQPGDQPAVGGGNRARPLRGELDVQALLQRLQPGGEGVVGLGREAPRGQGERLHHRRRLHAHLREEHLRDSPLRSMQVHHVAGVAQRLGHLGRQQADAQQLELRLQAAVRSRDEAQPQPAETNLEAIVCRTLRGFRTSREAARRASSAAPHAIRRLPPAPGGHPGAAVEEDRGMIDEGAQDAEQLGVAQAAVAAAPGFVAAGEAIVVGLVDAPVGGAEVALVGQLVPGQAGPAGEHLAAAALLHHRLDLEVPLLVGRHPEGHPLGRRGGRPLLLLRIDLRQVLVQGGERDLPGGQAQQLAQRLVLLGLARVAEKLDHRLERGLLLRGRDLLGQPVRPAVPLPAQGRLVPPEQQQRGLVLAEGARPAAPGVGQRPLLVAQHRHRLARHLDPHRFIGPLRARQVFARGGQAADRLAQPLGERRQHLVFGVAPVLLQEGAGLAPGRYQRGDPVQEPPGCVLAVVVAAADLRAGGGLDQDLPVGEPLALPPRQEGAGRPLGADDDVVQPRADPVLLRPDEQLLRVRRWGWYLGRGLHAGNIASRASAAPTRAGGGLQLAWEPSLLGAYLRGAGGTLSERVEKGVGCRGWMPLLHDCLPSPRAAGRGSGRGAIVNEPAAAPLPSLSPLRGARANIRRGASRRASWTPSQGSDEN